MENLSLVKLPSANVINIKKNLFSWKCAGFTDTGEEMTRSFGNGAKPFRIEVSSL